MTPRHVPRYVVHVSEGFPTAGRGNTKQGPGVTATVHDRLLLCRVVGRFRSEEYLHPTGRTGAPPKAETIAWAIEDAQQLALQLNRADA